MVGGVDEKDVKSHDALSCHHAFLAAGHTDTRRHAHDFEFMGQTDRCVMETILCLLVNSIAFFHF